MPRRHPSLPPRLWLMTDERMGDDLWRALARLPRGSGIVFRHYATPPAARRRLFRRIAAMARAKGWVLVRAGRGPLGGGEDGVHGRRGRGLITWPVHDRGEALRAVRAGADLVFISPVHPTRSHPGAPALGLRPARAIVAGLPVRPVALGGMTRRNGRTAMRSGFWGWAAIDGWSA
jgi:thiamine-phosphate pyrophosphorylase